MLNRLVTMIALVCAAAVGLTGCSDDEDKAPKQKKVTGVAKTVDLKNSDFSMLYRTDKGEEIELRGEVRPDTEVWINGRAHKLADVRVGDSVTVFGYRDKSSDEVKLVATRIEVDRPESLDWKKPEEKADDAAAAPAPGGAPEASAKGESTAPR